MWAQILLVQVPLSFSTGQNGFIFGFIVGWWEVEFDWQYNSPSWHVDDNAHSCSMLIRRSIHEDSPFSCSGTQSFHVCFRRILEVPLYQSRRRVLHPSLISSIQVLYRKSCHYVGCGLWFISQGLIEKNRQGVDSLRLKIWQYLRLTSTCKQFPCFYNAQSWRCGEVLLDLLKGFFTFQSPLKFPSSSEHRHEMSNFIGCSGYEPV